MRNTLNLFHVAILLFFLFVSCTTSSTQTDVDSDSVNSEHDIHTEAEEDSIVDKDGDFVDSDVTDSDSELPDIDMHCPFPYQAQYPYHRNDGTIHFCRPCDTPDEYDPQCVKSLWKDLNKEVYDIFKEGGFEDNEWIQECYPWPCEWNQIPTTSEEMPLSVMECDIRINPYSWRSSFTGSRKESTMDNGKIMFKTENYRIGDVGQFKSLSPDGGYQGQRAVSYDIKAGKYTVLTGSGGIPAYMNNRSIIDISFSALKSDGVKKFFYFPLFVVPHKDSFKYTVLYYDEDYYSLLDTFPFITDKWTVMVVNHLDTEDNPMSTGARSLLYAKTGEWKWTTLGKGVLDGQAAELSISGDSVLFYHYGTNATWLCDLSKNPQKVEDCKKVGRDGEVAGFPKFDRDNPHRIIYRSIREGEAANKFVILDISQEPWKIEKEFDIPKAEKAYLATRLSQVRSNVLLYTEVYILDADGYQEDSKLCFYRLDTGKNYCSKLIGERTEYNQGFASFEGKYLFWQPSYAHGYILRDMECYCEKAGVCPYDGMSELPSMGVGN